MTWKSALIVSITLALAACGIKGPLKPPPPKGAPAQQSQETR